MSDESPTTTGDEPDGLWCFGRTTTGTNPIRAPVEESTATGITEDNADEYLFKNSNRGLALIFNNERFKPSSMQKDRPGSSKDADNMDRSLRRLGFQVKTYLDSTRDTMIRKMKKASERNFTDDDCFVCVFLSHGSEVGWTDAAHYDQSLTDDVVYGTDDYVLTSHLLRFFRDDKCPTLVGKPRLFFIQACRGWNLDHGVDMATFADDQPDAASDPMPIRRMPCFSDFLVMYATPPGYFAFRRTITGSWFVEALSLELDRYSERENLMRLLTRVIRRVSREYESSNIKYEKCKQTPSIISMLTKDIFMHIA